jgi:hypothetical protein
LIPQSSLRLKAAKPMTSRARATDMMIEAVRGDAGRI